MMFTTFLIGMAVMKYKSILYKIRDKIIKKIPSLFVMRLSKDD